MIETKDIYDIRFTLNELLEDRGFGPNNINIHLSIEEVEILTEEFKNNDGILDLFLPGNLENRKKVYIKWFNKVDGEKSDNLLTKTYDMITMINGMTRNDDIIFIFADNNLENITDKMKEWVNSKPNVSLFNYKDLIYNVSKHKYVPKHKKITKTEILELKKNLKLESLLQLPAIEKQILLHDIMDIEKVMLLKF